MSDHLPQLLVTAADRLTEQLAHLEFSEPVSHLYNPLDYGRGAHTEYLERYARGPRRIIFLGMNPGPFGMVQTGIPFGEIDVVQNWLKIATPVGRPVRENPQRPVEGFNCRRSEVSGARLWGLFRERFVSPEAFFTDHFVANYCPLAFFQGGRNLTPDKLPSQEVAPLLAACDEHLRALVQGLQAQWVIGIGAYAEAQARRALAGQAVRIGRILHPSPASPAANRGWAPQALAGLEALGVW